MRRRAAAVNGGREEEEFFGVEVCGTGEDGRFCGWIDAFGKGILGCVGGGIGGGRETGGRGLIIGRW